MFQFEIILREEFKDFNRRSPVENLKLYINKYYSSDTEYDVKLTPNKPVWAKFMYDHLTSNNILFRFETLFAKRLQAKNSVLDRVKMKELRKGFFVFEFPGAPISINSCKLSTQVNGLSVFVFTADSGAIQVFVLSAASERMQVTLTLNGEDDDYVQDCLDTALKDVIERDGAENIPQNSDLPEFVVKALIYLSTDYDVEKVNSPVINTQNPRKIRSALKRAGYMFDHSLLSFKWKNAVNYSENSWGVEGFFRLQPYGEGLKKSKLIWIDSHIRNRSEDLIRVKNRSAGKIDTPPNNPNILESESRKSAPQSLV